MDDDSRIEIWTDGSCSIHGEYAAKRYGGWAFFGLDGRYSASRYGWAIHTTVNVMELTAIIRALQFYSPVLRPLVIYTDSQYSKNAIQGHWQTTKNLRLLEVARKLISRRPANCRVEIKWIAGHSGNFHNERVDKLASHARNNRCSNWQYIGANGLFLPDELT